MRGAKSQAGFSVLDGLYKVEYGVNDAFGRSIMCMHNGKLLGGNSAFAHLGTYRRNGDEIAAELITERHNADTQYYKPLMGTDVAAIKAVGKASSTGIRFEGEAAPVPGALFWANFTRLDDEGLPPRGDVGPGGIVNGLYSIHIRTLDGIDGGLSGVMLLIDGRILGGDAFFYYLGCYSSADGRWKGEIVNQEHTPAKDENPVFGGHEVGIGFSGTCSAQGAELEAIALAGKRSLRLTATLKLMRKA
nr:GrlR family regulatory protein [Bradyrhizobium lablabi]